MDIDALLSETTGTESGSSDLAGTVILEKLAPDILPYDASLVDRTVARLREQIDTVEQDELTTGLLSIILQSDIERVRYLLRSYMRTRLWKIDTYAQSLLAEPAQQGRLSPLERQYLFKHAALLGRHLEAAALDSMPSASSMKRLNDKAAAGISMVDEPDLTRAVFAVAHRAVTYRVGNRESFNARAGQIVLAPYESLRQYVPDHVTLL